MSRQGRIVSIKRFKTIVIGSATALICCVIAALSLLGLYGRTLQQRQSLQEEMSLLRDKFLALRQERDVLLARLVLAEKEAGKRIGTEAAVSAQTEKAKDALDGKVRPGAKIAGRQTTAADASDGAARRGPDRSLMPPGRGRVRVTDFKVVHGRGRAARQVQFKLKNLGTGSERLAGYALVILKPDESDPDTWMSVPEVNLVAGKPSRFSRGHYFAIANFKVLKLRAAKAMPASAARTATVLIFDKQGELLLAKSFALPPGDT